jgi:hypothetical protein
MFNKDIFITKCIELGLTKEAAEAEYKRRLAKGEIKQQVPFKKSVKCGKKSMKAMEKMAYDLGFMDCVKLFNRINEGK